MRESLRSVPIFAGLEDGALELLMAKAKEMETGAGTCILPEGETSNRLHIIVEGSVRVCKRLGKRDEVELARLGAGEFFGEMCILETLPRSASVVAITNTRLLSLSAFDFLHLHQQQPAQYGILVLNLARDLSRRLRRLDEVFTARH